MVEVLVIFDVKKGDLSTFVCLDMKLGVIKFGEITSSYLISKKSEGRKFFNEFHESNSSSVNLITYPLDAVEDLINKCDSIGDVNNQ